MPHSAALSRWRSRAAALAITVVATGCAITPEPVTDAERRIQIEEDRTQLYATQEPVTGPVTLAEAMARAIKYNVTHRLKAMEEALSQQQLDVARYDLLPRLSAEAELDSRNNTNASSSRSILTGRQSLEPSTSQDRDRKTGDLTLAWNILDFGISYFQAKQQANRTLVAAEKQRKVLHDLMQDVRVAYWKAVSAQQLGPKIDRIRLIAESGLADSRTVEQEQLKPLVETLRYQKALLDILKKMEAMRDELSQAKPELAALMNLPPGTSYELAVPGAASMTTPRFALALDAMEHRALLRRPELVEAVYEGRISGLETRKAIARMLPGIEINFSGNFDSNSFLFHQTWYETGLRVTWNLFSLFARQKGVEVAEAQEGIAAAQRLALSMAVLSQVHVAWRQFEGQSRQFERSKALYDIERRILDNVSAGVAAETTTALEAIRSESSSVLAELSQFQSYASLQRAAGRLYATLGLDPVPGEVRSHSVSDLTVAIGAVLDQWHAGRLGES